MKSGILNDFRAAAADLGVKGIVVMQNGETIDAHHWDEEHRRNQYSASKSFTSAAVGIAVREGLLRMDERVADCFPDELPENPCDHLLALTVKDLLTMCMGQDSSLLMGGDRPFMKEKDWVRYTLRQPFAWAPGTTFRYSNAGPYLAGMLVQRRCGCDLVSYLMPRLFAPLGMLRPTWETDPLGCTFGAGGLYLCVSELAAFCQLYLDRGMKDGRSLIPAEWIDESRACHAKTEGRGDGGYGYGYLFWLGREHSYRADGKYGQIGLVLEEKNAVVAFNADSSNPQRILDCIWETVWPKL